MLLLSLVSLLWAFSFGLTKGVLQGVSPEWVAAARLGLAGLVFLPFWRPGIAPMSQWLRLMGVGAVQAGLMYLCYNQSYLHLQAHQVALFTLTTPIFVALVGCVWEKQFRATPFLAAALAVLAGAVVTFKATNVGGTLEGILWVQASNLCFALGQVWYRAERRHWGPTSDGRLFAALYLGAFGVALPVAWLKSGVALPDLSAHQAWILVYLGVISSGLGFFLWNVGALRVSTGSLAVMNNAKVPLAIVCSLAFFNENADLPRLFGALALLGLALTVSERHKP